VDRVRRVIFGAHLRHGGGWKVRVGRVMREVREREAFLSSEASRRAQAEGGSGGVPRLEDVPVDVEVEVGRSKSLGRVSKRVEEIEGGEVVPSHAGAHAFLAWARAALHAGVLRRAREAALENWNVAVGFAEYRMCVRTLYTWKVHLLERRSMRVAAGDARLIKMVHMCFMSLRLHTGRRQQTLEKIRRAMGHSTLKVFRTCFVQWTRVISGERVRAVKIGEALVLRRRLLFARLRGGARRAVQRRAAVRRAVQLWQGNLLAKGLTRWAREAAERRRLEEVARGALARLGAREMTLAWNRLRENVDGRKRGRALALEAMRVWAFRLESAAFRGWAEGAQAQVDAKARAGVVLRRLQNRAALQALARLRQHAVERARLQRAAKRWRHVELAKCFGAWADAVDAWAERRERAARALAHWENASLAAAWRSLGALAGSRRRGREAASKWRSHTLWRALRRWTEFADECEAVREVGRRVVIRIALSRQASCLRTLREAARARRVMRKAAARWRGTALHRAFSAWAEFRMECGVKREQATRAVRAWAQRGLAAGLRTLSAHAETQHALRRAISRWNSGLLARALAAWREHAAWMLWACDAASRVVARWEGREKLAAFRRLRAQARASAGLKAALKHWREGELARAFGTWVEVTSNAQWAREAQLRALTLWQHAAQGRYLLRLREFTWTQRALRRAVASWTRAALARAFRGWVDELARRARGKALAAQAVARMRESLLWRCLCTLLDGAEQSRESRGKRDAADGHWNIFSKSRAFREWRDCAQARRAMLVRMEGTLELMDVLRKRRSLKEWRDKHSFIVYGRKAINNALAKRETRWVSAAFRSLRERKEARKGRRTKVEVHLTVTRESRCWAAWKGSMMRSREMRVVQAKIVRRMVMLKQARALAAWAAFAERRARERGILSEAAALRGARSCRIAMSLLQANVPQSRRKREITQAAIGSLYLRLIRFSFKRWAQVRAEVRASREALGMSVGHWAAKVLARGIRAWREALLEIRALRDLGEVASAHRERHQCAESFSKLRAAVERGRKRRKADAAGVKVAELRRAGAVRLCLALWKRERVALRHAKMSTSFRLFWRWHAFAGWQQERREKFAAAIFQAETSAAHRALRGWVSYVRECEERREELARQALEERRRHTLLQRSVRRMRLAHLRVAMDDLRRHALISSVVRTRARLATARLVRSAVTEWHAFCAQRAVMKRKLSKLLRVLGSRMAREALGAWHEATLEAKAQLAEDYAAARKWRMGVLARQAMRVWVAHMEGGVETKKSHAERAERERIELAEGHRNERLVHFAFVGWRLHVRAAQTFRGGDDSDHARE